MAAPEGNQFWKLRSKHGRNRIFATPKLLWEAATEYFEWCDNHPEYIVEQKKGNQSIKLTVKGNNNIDSLAEQLSSLISIPTKRPYTIQGLCLYCDCGTQFFHQFEDSLKDKEDEISKDFSLICSRIREIIYNQKFTGAVVGYFNHAIIARDLGLVDKKDLTSDNKPLDNIGVVINIGGEELTSTIKYTSPDNQE